MTRHSARCSQPGNAWRRHALSWSAGGKPSASWPYGRANRSCSGSSSRRGERVWLTSAPSSIAMKPSPQREAQATEDELGAPRAQLGSAEEAAAGARRAHAAAAMEHARARDMLAAAQLRAAHLGAGARAVGAACQVERGTACRAGPAPRRARSGTVGHDERASGARAAAGRAGGAARRGRAGASSARRGAGRSRGGLGRSSGAAGQRRDRSGRVQGERRAPGGAAGAGAGRARPGRSRRAGTPRAPAEHGRGGAGERRAAGRARGRAGAARRWRANGSARSICARSTRPRSCRSGFRTSKPSRRSWPARSSACGGRSRTLNREGRERLRAAFAKVEEHFEALFVRLFGGGRARLSLTDLEDPLAAGLELAASPPGKKLQSLSLLSGGEKALTALALIFAVFLTRPSPLCVLDEVDAPLDDANVERLIALLDELSPRDRHPFPRGHPSPADHGAHASSVRRDHGRAGPVPAGVGRPRARRGACVPRPDAAAHACRTRRSQFV